MQENTNDYKFCINLALDNAKKNQTNSNSKNQKLGQTKNSAKLVLFIFGIGPIIGIIIFLK